VLNQCRPSRASRRVAAAAAGVWLDRLLGEPPDPVHPLRGFGALMAIVENSAYRDTRAAGTCYTASGVVSGALFGALGGSGTASVAAASYLACGGRALADAAAAVGHALACHDLVEARARAGSLVGRDVADLDEPALARAAVESVAENTVDAVIAPLCFAAAAGAPGVLAYRAANTLDALVGYRNPRYERFGWASARLDDLANLLPSRLTALLVALVRPWKAPDVVRVVVRDAPGHPSPNAGVAEAAFAAALGLRLGGTNTYGGVADERPEIGDGRRATADDVDRAVRLSYDVGDAAVVLALLLAVLLLLLAADRRGRRGRRVRCAGHPDRAPAAGPPDR